MEKALSMMSKNPGDNTCRTHLANRTQTCGSTAVSLFAGGGIGDLALRACGVEVLVASELLPDRCEVYETNYPETALVAGDIRKTKSQIILETRKRLEGRQLDILFATPPCQGMSKNGRGKLLNGIRAGIKPEFDERNQLAFEAIEIALALKPKVVVFENVPEMENTLVEKPSGGVGDLMASVAEMLEPEYSGRWEVVEFADYGVPQRRQRLISVFARVDPVKSLARAGRTLLPRRTHSAEATMFTKRWVSVEEALRGVPPLDASSPSKASHATLEFHRVPILDEQKYFWVANTPYGKGAFDNQCVNPNCSFAGNITHGSQHDEEGINRAHRDTPIRCIQCGELLPRPWVLENGKHRLMSGFTSAYKRMRGDLPASALTRNLSYACSDQKIHPRENRVLSLHEAFVLHTVSKYSFRWRRPDGRRPSDKTIREILGESIPPLGLEVIFKHLLEMLGDSSDQIRSDVMLAPNDGLRSESLGTLRTPAHL